MVLIHEELYILGLIFRASRQQGAPLLLVESNTRTDET